MTGLYIVIGILIAIVLLLAWLLIAPKMRRYRFTIRPMEPKKKRAKPVKKKKRQVWVRII